MLTIRGAQMDVLEAEARRRFEEDVKARELSLYPAEAAAIASADWDHLIPAAIDRAIGFGIDEHAGMERFVDYVVLFGADFDAAPEREWMAEILTDPDLPGREKIAWIDDGLLPKGGA